MPNAEKLRDELESARSQKMEALADIREADKTILKARREIYKADQTIDTIVTMLMKEAS